MILSILLSIILILLALVHFNWVLGGTFGFKQSLPTKENGERVLNPKKIDSAIVALGLTAFGVFYLFISGLIGSALPKLLVAYVGWVIPVLFILRAIGDFKYIGFFKRVKKTDFGKLDTLLFSPLCMLIGVFGIVIQLVNK